MKPASGPFDIVIVRDLVRLMRKFELTEVDLQDGDKRLKLRRGPKLAVASAPVAVPNYAAPQLMGQPAPAPAPAPAQPAPAPVSKLVDIKSPMVGTFYAKPAPDKDDFVKVGSRVNGDSIVCKIEAMKIFNDIAAGVSGTIAEVCVQNAQFVEYDQVLFRVDPT